MRTESPAALAGRPLFEPLAGFLSRFTPGLPEAGGLNTLVTGMADSPLTGNGWPLRFAPPAGDGLGYEARIFASGAVEHRPDNWHDFFNALVWLAFPLAKAALSLRHGHVLATCAQAGPRGPIRDALTQFDECGVAVVSSDPSLLERLRRHEWKEVFWRRRAELLVTSRFFVFGHATYDQLRAPFFGLCAKAVYLEAAPEWLEQNGERQRSDLDARLADWLAHALQTPKDLKPLPLLGIPGVVPENGDEAYYDDSRQFRPTRGR